MVPSGACLTFFNHDVSYLNLLEEQEGNSLLTSKKIPFLKVKYLKSKICKYLNKWFLWTIFWNTQ